MRATFVVWESHDIPRLVFVGLGLEVSSTSSDEFGVLGEEREDIEVRVVQDRVLTVLGVDGTQSGLIAAVGVYDFNHRFVGVL